MKGRDQLQFLLRALLRPVARLCVAHAISVRELLELAKRELLLAAEAEAKRKKEKMNTSRLSVMTGIQRKDIIRIQEEGEEVPSSQSNLIARVIGKWEQDPNFTTRAGKPRVLSTEGDDSEFRSLVADVSTDLNPGTVLHALERIGAVERSTSKVRLKKAALSIQNDEVAGYTMLAADIEDLSLSVQDNLTRGDRIPHLHARTEYDNLLEEALPEIHSWILHQGAAFHEIVRTYLARFDKDLHPELKGNGGGQLVFGTFSRTTRSKD